MSDSDVCPGFPGHIIRNNRTNFASVIYLKWDDSWHERRNDLHIIPTVADETWTLLLGACSSYKVSNAINWVLVGLITIFLFSNRRLSSNLCLFVAMFSDQDAMYQGNSFCWQTFWPIWKETSEKPTSPSEFPGNHFVILKAFSYKILQIPRLKNLYCNRIYYYNDLIK